MNVTTIIGIVASVFTGISLLPQLFKIVKEKKADGTSLGMLCILLTGLCLWIIYGVKINDLILVIANGFSALANFTIIALRFYYQTKSARKVG